VPEDTVRPHDHEPTANLGSRSATGILDLLASLRRENQMTVIIATHDPQIAARCDRLIRLRDGAVIDDIEIADGQPATRPSAGSASSARPRWLARHQRTNGRQPPARARWASD
jgi:ABC-type glutathione transport system ATPase component